MFQMTLWKRLGVKYTMECLLKSILYNYTILLGVKYTMECLLKSILYNYTIQITIPILECILKRNELTIYKDSIYLIFFKLSGKSFPHITTKEYNLVLNVFNVVSSIYEKYKPDGREIFPNYSFVLKKLLIMLRKVEYAKCIPPLKTYTKQKELERVWELITKDPELAVALRKQRIAWALHLNSARLVVAFERIYLWSYTHPLTICQ